MNKSSRLEKLFKKDEQRKNESGVSTNSFYSRPISGSVTKQFKRIRSTKPVRILSGISHLLSHASTRVYGAVLMTFGFVGIMMYILRVTLDTDIITPIIGAGSVLLSLPLLFADKPLPIFLADNDFTDHLFYEIFCMKRHMVTTVAKFPIILAIVIGFALAAISVFLPFWQIALVMGILVFVYSGIESPEFVFLASIFTLPYVRFLPNGDMWLLCAVAFAFVSFLLKVLVGKRVIYIEQYDIFIGIMMLLILVSGIFVKGEESFSGSIRMIILAIGYILTGNIIANRRLAERSVNAVIVSGVICALVSVFQIIFAVVQAQTVTLSLFDGILARQDGIAVFLIVGIIFATGMIKQSAEHSRSSYTFSAIIMMLAIIMSGEFFALCAVLLSVPVYYILKNNFRPGFFLPLLLLVPLATMLLPNMILDVIFYLSPSVESAEDLFALWNESLGVWSNNLFLGIGIGSESFKAELGATGHLDSSNLFIELGLEAGVFALLAFICILLTRIKHRSVQYLYVRNSDIERLSCISGACMFSLLAFGMVNYIWSEPSAYYFFWCLLGVGSATLRVARKDYDDKVVYYEESSAFDSSVIDIEIG